MPQPEEYTHFVQWWGPFSTNVSHSRFWFAKTRPQLPQTSMFNDRNVKTAPIERRNDQLTNYIILIWTQQMGAPNKKLTMPDSNQNDLFKDIWSSIIFWRRNGHDSYSWHIIYRIMYGGFFWGQGRLRSKEEKRCQRPNWSKQTQTGDRAWSCVQIQNHCGWSNNRLLFGRLRRWVGGWVQGAPVGKSLLWFLVDIHLSWFCQPPTLSNVEQ